MSSNREFLRGVARAYGGSIIFALPMFMTMEMWSLGFDMGRFRLMLLLLMDLPLLVGLSYFAGLRKTFSWKEDVVDALVAYAVGATSALGMLYLTRIINPDMTVHEMAGKVTIQAVPGAIGALLAQSQLGSTKGEARPEKREPGYIGELFLMAVGGVFLAFNIAPTQEIVVISQRVSHWHAVAIAIISLLIMHAFVYAMSFQGGTRPPREVGLWSIFLRYTVAGYALCLLLSAVMLWFFGRMDGTGHDTALVSILVLGLPTGIGGASARLVL